MKKFLIASIVLLSLNSYAQVDVMSGMGITFQSTPSLTDYINNIVPAGEELSDYSSAVAFFGEVDYEINKTFELGIEYEYRLFSFTSATGFGIYELNSVTHSPTLLAYYVLQGTGYKFKFGGGAGYRFQSVDEEDIDFTSSTNFTSSGFGLVLKAQAHTLLGGNFHAYIGADIRYDLIGEPSSGSREFGGDFDSEIDFNTLGVGVKVGISYFIR